MILLVVACDDTDPGAEMIQTVRTAEKVHAYRGTKDISYGTGEGKRHEYIVTHFPSDGVSPGPTIMERTGNGKARRWVEWKSRHEYWLRDSDRLLKNYRVERAGAAEVAGRVGTVFEVRSRLADAKRPSLTLVVDDESGLLLSYRQMNWRGEQTIVSAFATLVLGPDEMPERPVRTEEAGEDREKAGEAPDRTAFTLLSPRFLPAGFEARSAGRPSGRSGKGWKTIYSDGLTWFEIRQWPAKAGTEEGVLKRCVRGSHVWMRMAHDGVSLSLYGSLDPAELESVLRSLAREE